MNYSYLCGLIFIFVAMSMGEAFGAANGSLTIGGVVLPVNQLSVVGLAGSGTLDLSRGATEQAIAVINEKNNDPDGYTVSLVSLNARATSSGQARLHPIRAANSTSIVYTIKYGASGSETEIPLNDSGSAIVTSTSVGTPEAGSTKLLKITIPTATWLKADTYVDTIALTISAK